jgi:hypothetical protein
MNRLDWLAWLAIWVVSGAIVMSRINWLAELASEAWHVLGEAVRYANWNRAWHFIGEAVRYPNWSAVSAVIQALSAVVILVLTYQLVRANRQLVIVSNPADPLVDIQLNYVGKRFYMANFCSYPVYGVSIMVMAKAESKPTTYPGTHELKSGPWDYNYENTVATLKKLPARTSWNPTIAPISHDIVSRMLRHERAIAMELLTNLSPTRLTFEVVYYRDFDNRKFSKRFEADLSETAGEGPGTAFRPPGFGIPILRQPGPPEAEGPAIPVLRPEDVAQPSPVPIAKGVFGP